MTNIIKKLNTTKTFYMLSGIALMVLLSLFIQNYVYAAPKEGKKYGDWVINCEKDAKNKKTCFLSLTLTNQDKESKKSQFVANFRLGYFNKSKNLQMIQILPFGINLQSGATLIANKKALSQGVFTTCESYGCIAATEIKPKDVEILAKDKEAFIGVFTATGQQINFPISSKGIKEGLEALKK